MNREITNYVWMGEVFQINESNFAGYLSELKSNGIGGIIYRSDRPEFPQVAKAAKEAGSLVEAWYPTLICTNKKQDDIDKSLFAVSKNGDSALEKPPYVDYYKWLCPNNEDVFTLIQKDLKKILSIVDVDSIHLDYIRYCDIFLPKGLWNKYGLVMDRVFSEYDFCYCETCRSKFKEVHGIDPITISANEPNYHKWVDFRLNSVSNLVLKIKKLVHGYNKEISAAVFPGPEIAINNVLQDWSKWDLDRYFPMNYNTFYLKDGKWIGKMVKNEVNSTNGEIISGIYLNNITIEDYEKGLYSSIDAGAKGLAFFVPEEMEKKHWSILKKVISYSHGEKHEHITK